MFKRLPISSGSNLFLRCIKCHTLLFHQSDICQYLSFSPSQVSPMPSFPSSITQLSYFMLKNQIFISSLKINLKQSTLTNYHPFLKMFMFKIMCQQCQHVLGYQVEVANVFTSWIKDRILIDCNQIECLHQNRNVIKRLVLSLNNKLVKSIKHQKQLIQEEQKKTKKIRQIKQRLSKMSISTQKMPIPIQKMSIPDEGSKKSLVQKNISKTFVSTMPQTFVSTMGQTCTQKNQAPSQIPRSIQCKLDPTNLSVFQNISISYQQQPHYPRVLPRFGIKSQQQKQLIQQGLYQSRDNIEKVSKFISGQNVLMDILMYIHQLDCIVQDLDSKYPQQIIKFQTLMTSIRTKVLRPLQEGK